MQRLALLSVGVYLWLLGGDATTQADFKSGPAAPMAVAKYQAAVNKADTGTRNAGARRDQDDHLKRIA